MFQDTGRNRFAGHRFAGLKAASGAALLAIAIALGGCATAPATDGASAVSASQTAPIATGQKIVMATHSFNVFVGPTRASPRDPNSVATPGPLAALAAERGKQGHETLAVQMIGGSTPMQHWNQGDGDDTKNIAKAALNAGGVDVFTMSPNAIMPEEGIDHFGDLVIRTNPGARIMVQNSWSAYDGNGSTPSVGGSGGGDFRNVDRDQVTTADIDGWLTRLEAEGGYLDRLRTQLEGIDRRAGKEITFVVPSGSAVYELRKHVIAEKVPGVKLQSDLFRDPIGHSTPPTSNLVTYVWYAAMYRESPVGLQAFVDRTDPTSAAREKILQQIAWNAVVSEPKSGVKAEPVKVDG